MGYKKIILILIIGYLFIYCGEISWSAPVAEIKSVTVKKVSDNTVDPNNQITWSGVTPKTTDWKRANQYLEIKFYSNYAGWGLQIFTDNAFIGRDGPPYIYTGTYVIDPNTNNSTPDNPNGDPPDAGDLAGDFAAGLVYETGKYTLPMCWRAQWPEPFKIAPAGGWLTLQDYKAKDKTYNTSIKEFVDADDNTDWRHLRRDDESKYKGVKVGDDGYNCWIHMRDKAFDGWSNPIDLWGKLSPNVNIAWSYVTPYILYPTVVNEMGIHHADGTGASSFGWGAGPPPNASPTAPYVVYVYLGAKFQKVAGGDYKAKVYIQLYHF